LQIVAREIELFEVGDVSNAAWYLANQTVLLQVYIHQALDLAQTLWDFPIKYCSYFREQIWLVIVEFNRLFEMSSDFRKVNSEKSGKYCKPKEERLRPTTFLLESHVI